MNTGARQVRETADTFDAQAVRPRREIQTVERVRVDVIDLAESNHGSPAAAACPAMASNR